MGENVTPLDLAGKRVLVLGLGISGGSAARFCAERGAQVVAADERPADRLTQAAELGPGIAVRCGEALPDAADFDLVVPSPGIPRERYASRAKQVCGDIELTYRALQVPMVAVTGTNGKSTTTMLVQALLQAAGLRAAAAGNLGEPALGLVGQALDAAVLEVSSFQLETIDTFQPAVAVVLNISPDHLDRHGDLRTYVAAKARILENQTAADAAVLNVDDPEVNEFAATAKGRVFSFSRRRAQDRGAWIDADSVMLSDGSQVVRIGLEALPLAGHHNRDNAAMALCAVLALGADVTRAAHALPTFRGLPHRSEVVAEIGGVSFIDDSKATNPGAAARALESHTGRVIWIAGGRDKGLDFAPLAEPAARYVRSAFLIGEAAEALDAALPPSLPREHCTSLEQAVTRAAEIAEPGDVVLLAPACASFDQFSDFAERGRSFRAAAIRLDAGGGMR